jgi:hypothetical protein
VSDPSGKLVRAWRNHSLIQRFTRLRITEPPTRLLTVSPNRFWFSRESPTVPLVLDAITTTKLSELRRFPDLAARRKSWVHKTRSARRKRPVLKSTDLLRGNTSCEAFSAFGAASLQNCSARARLGSRAEPVGSFPTNAARLIGTFHRRPSIFILSRAREVGGRFPSDVQSWRRDVLSSPILGNRLDQLFLKARLSKIFRSESVAITPSLRQWPLFLISI